MKDLLGTRYDFTVAEGLPEVIGLRIRKGGEAVDLTNSTWRGLVYAKAGGEPQAVGVEHGVHAGQVLLTFPALAGATHRWELFCGNEEGDMKRKLYGEVTAISSEAARVAAEMDASTNVRELAVDVAEDEDAPWQLFWKGTSMAAYWARVAMNAADGCQGVLDEASDTLEMANRAVLLATESIEKLDGLDELLEDFKTEIASQVYIAPESGTWIIGGKDSRYPARGPAGEDGKPGKDGRDGLDGDIIRSIEVAELPDTTAVVSGALYYLKLSDGSHEVYKWIETIGGGGGWAKQTEPIPLATSAIYGLTKLGREGVVDEGAGIGVNDSGQLVLPMASTSEPGAVMAGSSVDSFNSQPYVEGVSTDAQRHMAIDLANGGALMHMTGADWAWERNVHGGSEGIDHEAMNGRAFYTGLRTSAQFEQSQSLGLVLKSGNTTLLGGLYVAEGIDDKRENAALTPAQAVAAFPKKDDVFLKAQTYSKESVYMKSETDLAISRAVEEVKRWVQEGAPLEDILPPGFVCWAAVAQKDGWLRCDGSMVSRETYPRLFAAIGTKFNHEDDSDTAKFRLPDMRGRTTWGAESDAEVGETKEPKLPNIRARSGEMIHLEYLDGAFYESGYVGGRTYVGGGYRSGFAGFDASRVSSIYSDDCDTVQPPAVVLNCFIKV